MLTNLFTLLPLLSLSLALAAPSASPASTTLHRRAQVSGKLRSFRSGLCIGSGGNNALALVACSSDKAYKVSLPRDQSGAWTVSGNAVLVDGDLKDGAGVKVGVFDKYGPKVPNGQIWWYTSDDRVAIYEGTHCLDESDGNKIQIWQCFPGNTNQVWQLI